MYVCKIYWPDIATLSWSETWHHYPLTIDLLSYNSVMYSAKLSKLTKTTLNNLYSVVFKQQLLHIDWEPIGATVHPPSDPPAYGFSDTSICIFLGFNSSSKNFRDQLWFLTVFSEVPQILQKLIKIIEFWGVYYIYIKMGILQTCYRSYRPQIGLTTHLLMLLPKIVRIICIFLGENGLKLAINWSLGGLLFEKIVFQQI